MNKKQDKVSQLTLEFERFAENALKTFSKTLKSAADESIKQAREFEKMIDKCRAMEERAEKGVQHEDPMTGCVTEYIVGNEPTRITLEMKSYFNSFPFADEYVLTPVEDFAGNKTVWDRDDRRVGRTCRLWNCRGGKWTIGVPAKVLRQIVDNRRSIVGFIDMNGERWDKAEYRYK